MARIAAITALLLLLIGAQSVSHRWYMLKNAKPAPGTVLAVTHPAGTLAVKFTCAWDGSTEEYASVAAFSPESYQPGQAVVILEHPDAGVDELLLEDHPKFFARGILCFAASLGLAGAAFAAYRKSRSPVLSS